MSRIWNFVEETNFKSLWLANVSLDGLAWAFKRTENAIMTKASKMGLKRRSPAGRKTKRTAMNRQAIKILREI